MYVPLCSGHNERCTWLVFDNHDAWHFLAALALDLIFQFLDAIPSWSSKRDQEGQTDDQKKGPEASALMSKDGEALSPSVSQDGEALSPLVSQDGEALSPLVFQDGEALSPLVSPDGEALSPLVSQDGEALSPLLSQDGEALSPLVSQDNVERSTWLYMVSSGQRATRQAADRQKIKHFVSQRVDESWNEIPEKVKSARPAIGFMSTVSRLKRRLQSMHDPAQ